MKKLLLLLFVPMMASAGNYGTVTVSQLVSVYDGDTFTVNIDSLHPIIGEKIRIRINGIDTPEIRGKCDKEKKLAYRAKFFLGDLLSNAKVIEVRNIDRGKWFRLVGDVYVDGHNVAGELLNAGLALPYYHQKSKNNWCN